MESKKLHILVDELLPLYPDLEGEVKKIIDEHLRECLDCREYMRKIDDTFQYEVQEVQEKLSPNTKIQPFRRLIQFKRAVTFLLLFTRVLILILCYVNFREQYQASQSIMLSANLMVFYFPYICLVDGIQFVFFRNKWFWLILLFDIFMLLFFDDCIYLVSN